MNKKGYTLIEIIGVLSMVAILSAVAFKKTGLLTQIASKSVDKSVIVALDSNEMMVWAETMMENYDSDNDVWEKKDKILNVGDTVQFVGYSQTGATVIVDGSRVQLKRTPSSLSGSARWGPAST